MNLRPPGPQPAAPTAAQRARRKRSHTSEPIGPHAHARLVEPFRSCGLPAPRHESDRPRSGALSAEEGASRKRRDVSRVGKSGCSTKVRSHSCDSVIRSEHAVGPGGACLLAGARDRQPQCRSRQPGRARSPSSRPPGGRPRANGIVPGHRRAIVRLAGVRPIANHRCRPLVRRSRRKTVALALSHRCGTAKAVRLLVRI